MGALRICGLIIVVASILSLPAIVFLFVKRANYVTTLEHREAMARIAANERLSKDNAYALYQSERAARISAETKRDLLQHQLNRARQQMAKYKLKH